MPDSEVSNHADLSSRYEALKNIFDSLLAEAMMDGTISSDEQAMLDTVQLKLAEIKRRLETSGSGGGGGSGSAGAADESTDGSGSGGPQGRGDFLSDAMDAVTEAGSAAAGAVGEFLEDASEAASGAADTAQDMAEGAADSASDAANEAMDAAGDMFSEAAGAAADLVGDAVDAATGVAEDLFETFTGTASEIAQAAKDAAERAAAGIQSTVNGAVDTARQTAEAAMQEAADRATSAAEAAEQAAQEAQDAAGEAAEAAQQRAEQAAEEARAAASEAAAMLQSLVGEAGRQIEAAGQAVVDGAQGAAQQAEDAIETAVGEAQEAAEDAREQAESVEQEVRDLAAAARDLAGQAATRLGEFLQGARATVEEALATIIAEAEAAAERAEQFARQITGMGFTEAEEETLAELEAAGLDQQEREDLVRLARDDPAALAQATAALERMQELNVPAADRGELIRLAQVNEAGFEAAMEVIADMESGGPLDVSDDAMADLAVQISDTQQELTDASDAFWELVDAGAPQAEIDAAEATLNEVSNRLTPLTEDMTQRENKRNLLDALSYGPLSVDVPEPMPPEDVTALVEAYGRSPRVGAEAIEMASQAEDPGLIAQNVGAVLDVTEGGFAPPGGDPLEETYDGEFEGMAVNMLQNGANLGQEYFDGAADYYASGAQAVPDPCGGRDGDPVGEINNRRTAMMGRDMLDENGNVDINSDSANAAMDHMLYHPGSLSPESFSPNQTEQMQGVYDLFSDPATATDASAVINGIEAPAEDAPNGAGARDLVSMTMGDGLAPEDVDAEDTRAAVLSGMLSTFQQGDVGSCFATAPTRRQRIDDPIQAMENMAEIATTGQFVSASPNLPGPIPANLNIPEGENPIQRSFEYTIASGSAMLADSSMHDTLNDGLWGGGGPDQGLDELEGIVGAEAWNGSGEVDENGDLVDEGMETRLQRAIAQQLRFDYDAAGDLGGGGSDGRSNRGAFEIVYNGSVIENQADFQAAIEAIALGAANAPDADTADAIRAHVQSQDFIDTVLAPYGSQAPWDLSGGGWGTESVEVLTGEQTEEFTLNPPNSGQTQGAQTRDLLDNLVATIGGESGLTSLATTGDEANHEFSGTPDHPTFQAISGPDSAERIQEILVDPGQAMASEAMPEQQTSRLYEEQIRGMMRWPDVRGDEESINALEAALRNNPTEGLSPPDLQAYIDGQLGDFNTRQRELERERADAWRAGSTDPVTDADYQAYLDQMQAEAERAIENELRNNVVEDFDLPHVVVADSNWGDHQGSVQFAIAPDPLTGELRTYQRNSMTGEMTPLGDNWENAEWFATRPKP